MEGLASLLHGFSVALTAHHILLMMIGVLLGILVGVLPGLGAPNGVSLLLPLTFSMDPVAAIILLTSMYWGARCSAARRRPFFSTFPESHPRLPQRLTAIRWPRRDTRQKL